MFEEDRLEISRDLPESRRLVEELVRYGRDEGFQDDLVLALSLATWRLRLDYDDPPEDGGVKVRKGPMTARERQQADEFVGMIRRRSGSGSECCYRLDQATCNST